MLALYRAGRQADALATYQESGGAQDQLGLQPGAELQELEQAILRQDESLEPAARRRPRRRHRGAARAPRSSGASDELTRPGARSDRGAPAARY